MMGDSVFLLTKHLSIGYVNEDPSRRKLQYLYAGPFKLIKRYKENAFELDLPSHWTLHRVFNVARFKRDLTSGRPKEQVLPNIPPLRTTKKGGSE